MLKPDGASSVEVPYLLGLIDQLEFDTIYHEHLSYFSLHPIEHLFAAHGLACSTSTSLPRTVAASAFWADAP